MMLTTGNSKLQKTGLANNALVVAFTLPRAMACPEAGECREYCYGKSGPYQFPKPYQHAIENFKASKSLDFVERMALELTYFDTKSQLDGQSLWVRLHDLGDFYSTEYANKWKHLFSMFPRVNFYAYSTSLKILTEVGMMEGTKNFTLIPSYATASKELLPATFAYVWPEGMEPLPNSIVGNHDDIRNVRTYQKGCNVCLVAHGSCKNKVKKGL